MKKKIIYRVDGGSKLGYGHLYRAIELKKILKKNLNTDLDFLIKKEYDGYLFLKKRAKNAIFFKKNQFLNILKKKNYDAIIFDTALISISELKQAYRYKKTKIIVFEDFKNISKNYANLIINAIVSGSQNKKKKIKNGIKYVGSKYKIFKNNITRYQPQPIHKRNNFTITLGGGEVNSNEILNTIKRLYPFLKKYNFKINLIVGHGVDKKVIKKIKNLLLDIKIYINLNNIFSILSRSLFVVTGGGGTVYECAYFNCIPLYIVRAKHQRSNIRYFLKNRYGKLLPPLNNNVQLDKFFNEILLNKKFIRLQNNISKKIIKLNGINMVQKLISNTLRNKT
tara:strand:- start:3107 stop:4120 length:1014 start_codon:yes stop_codon:yes gene_type:complete